MQMLKLEKKAKFFKAMSEPIRLKIIKYLMKSECKCICHISKHLDRDQSVIFRHIKILEEAGIVQCSKKGKWLNCCIANKNAIKILEELK